MRPSAPLCLQRTLAPEGVTAAVHVALPQHDDLPTPGTRQPAPGAERMRHGDTAKGMLFQAASRRLCNSGALRAQAASSRARRQRSAGALTGLHLNPVQKVLAPSAVEPGYIYAIPDVALPI